MLFNYIKIAFRNLLRKKVFTAINIIGLSVGAAASLIIFLYVREELSYDDFLEDSRIYRVVEERKYPERLAHFTLIPAGFATVMPTDIPEVEASTRLIGFPNFATVVSYKDNVFSENYFFAADSNFFEVFPFKILKGDKKRILLDRNSLLLTASTAARYFGNEEPVGKFLKIVGQDVEVVGVMEDLPVNSHMKFDALGSSMNNQFIRVPDFYIASSYTYVRLAPHTSPKTVEAKMPPLVEKYASGQIERDLGVSYKKYVADGNGYTYLLQPIEDIHLTSHRMNEIQANGSGTAVNVLIMICILILVIAGINFVNLATARSTERAKEVGVRKVLGSVRKQLIFQFLAESLLISVISIVLAVIIVEASLDYFNTTYQKQLQLFGSPSTIIVLLAVTLGLGLISGLYPAFYISALKPVMVLKGKFQSSSFGHLLRNGLVVFQFTISIVLISATMIVYDQLDFIQDKSLGFEKENMVVINHNSNGKESAALQEELRSVPGVISVASGSTVPGGYFYGILFHQPGKEEIFTPKGFNADDNYVASMKLRVLEGRAFGTAFNDSLAVMINQKAAEALKLEHPIGSVIVNNANPTTPVRYTIVGVLEDFNYESLHLEIAPLVIMSTEGQLAGQSFLVARLGNAEYENTLKGMEAKWKTVLPAEPFDYTFMDTRLNKLYATENASGSLLTTFTMIAIIVACVGLFGLTAYTANQRTKEIGVRKVLGASVTSILGLLSKDFAILVAISSAIGAPMAWYLMSSWLQTFAFRVPLTVLPFLNAGIVVLLFTAVTVSYQAIKSAMVNPATTLKED